MTKLEVPGDPVHPATVKHHYVPQFLLRRWAGPTGRLYVFSIRNGRIVSAERSPEYTGFDHDLYGIVANVLGVAQDVIERKVFSPLDNNAAKALDRIERREVLSEDQHRAWTFFLSSLRVRQPDALRFLRGEGEERMKRTLAEIDAETIPSGAPTTREWFGRHFDAVVDASTLTSWLPAMIAQRDVVAAFGSMNWWVREFTADLPKLLLSDLPIHWEGGFGRELMIQLPIAPNRVFFGSMSKNAQDVTDRIPAADLVRRVNRTSLASSSERIWACERDDAAKFMEANREIMGVNAVDFGSLLPKAEARAAAANAVPDALVSDRQN